MSNLNHIWNRDTNKCKRCGLTRGTKNIFVKRYDGTKIKKILSIYYKEGKQINYINCTDKEQLKLDL